MSKSITGIDGSVIQPYYAVELLFDDGPLRLWTGYGDKTIEGNNYFGSGSVLSISGLEEVADMTATGCSVALSGIDSQIVSLALQEPYQGRSVRIFVGIEGEDPVEVFGGFIDVMSIEDQGDTSNVSVTVESRLVELERVRPFRYTDESQKSRYPNDEFFSYVADIQDKEIVWGRNKK